jgi:hypothetical protein
MACFLAPAATAIITTGLKKKIAPKYHLEWLNTMLWGGVIMLIVDHIANGEIVPYPPFLTAMQKANGISTMLREIITVGGLMTLAIFAVWATMVFVTNRTNHQAHEKTIQAATA